MTALRLTQRSARTSILLLVERARQAIIVSLVWQRLVHLVRSPIGLGPQVYQSVLRALQDTSAARPASRVLQIFAPTAMFATAEMSWGLNNRAHQEVIVTWVSNWLAPPGNIRLEPHQIAWSARPALIAHKIHPHLNLVRQATIVLRALRMRSCTHVLQGHTELRTVELHWARALLVQLGRTVLPLVALLPVDLVQVAHTV
jgi:hypothetical protein